MGDLWRVLTDNSDQFLSGFGVTVRLVVISFVIAMVVGTLVAALRIAPSKLLQRLGGVYVETFRNIPLLVLLFISFAGLRRAGVQIDPWVAGTASLGLYTAAYVAEALRSGVFAVGKGQIEAGLSLGLPYRAVMRRIVLPQATRIVIPAIGNEFIAMIKDSALVSIIGVQEVLWRAETSGRPRLNTLEAFVIAATIYWVLTILFSTFQERLERRMARGDR